MRESKRNLFPPPPSPRILDRAQLENSIQKIGKEVTKWAQPNLPLEQEPNDSRFVPTRPVSIYNSLKSNLVKGTNGPVRESKRKLSPSPPPPPFLKDIG